MITKSKAIEKARRIYQKTGEEILVVYERDYEGTGDFKLCRPEDIGSFYDQEQIVFSSLEV